MRRREVIGLIAGAAAWPLAGRAQDDRRRAVGVLMPYAESDTELEVRLAALKQELHRLGWVEGKNLRVHERWATDDLGRLRAHARELVGLGPDVILVTGRRVLPVIQQETRSIPVVFVWVTEPLGQGVASLARPGGNITGFAAPELSVFGKLPEILTQIAPHLTRAALLFNPDNPASVSYARQLESAAPALAIEPVIVPVHGPADIERAIETFAREPKGGLLFPSDLTLLAHRELIVGLAARHRLPAIYADRIMVASGGLASYAADRTEMYRQAASYVDRILRGEKPSDLPVQQPTRFELVINLRTAKALDLTIPPTLLARADEVIE
jgi:putative tryptophan/tyrosine transport system substrate-binding protein